MTGDEILQALAIPATARLDRRVPKTLLLEHGAPTASDRRRIADGIEQLQWVATLKPTTIGVAAYRDNDREYLEIAVLCLKLRQSAKASRLMELVHRAIPYPVVAVTEMGDSTRLSLAHKRSSQGEANKTVLDGSLVAVECALGADPFQAAFLDALPLARQPRSSLYSLYQAWIDAALALEAARRTNTFDLPRTTQRLAQRREALRECERLESHMSRLRAAATKEKQIARRVELNLDLQRAEAARAAAIARL